VAQAIAEVLGERALELGLTIPPPLASRLVAYYELLVRWNRTINLTSLSDPVEAVDRMLIEPVMAARDLPRASEIIDLGSGGGSPAVPLALALESPSLVMIESRVRKAAFLREVLREVGLPGQVEAARFEDVAIRPGFAGRFGLLSVRAVRLDASVLEVALTLLRTGGVGALFGTRRDPPVELPPGLRYLSSRSLVRSSNSALTLIGRV
jgi:16S rRNA (guanine527-N7)-methyltransferase